ncbi:GH32 C-terminal domain-containing protein [Streptomyces sp. NBC_01077]|uniref:GH32 C-terminal domain-containing protein n=1 Tax=Streptomyces sp. NBC_01077 TaxID=2903746 RepID=UPI00387053DA|nr:GH32 C-terminal domain-containing protein [Streptomyces sp. NBC_01077]
MSRVPARRRVPLRLVAAAAATCALTVTAVAPQAAAEDSRPYTETYRPQFHFSPAKNWMNDPNGLVWFQGEYHLFYQYNPSGNTWGNMSWGHAVSTDLVHWRELPLAIPHDDEEMVFSGSAVVDHDNTTGFGTTESPAMVAVYTSHYKDGGKQAQSLAYSTDRGRTWTKYAGNPVLDIESKEFRDPKVQWYAPTKSWLMTVSLSTERKVRFYFSKDLKSWTHLSDFGPQNAVGGVWECPDLFPLPVDGDPERVKWVLVVNINPGGIAGGSAAQYFVGDFDGKRFRPDDDGSYTPPPGVVVQDFEGAGYGTWQTTGTAFGDGPVPAPAPGTSGTSGFEGKGLVDSFHNGDAETGILTSPPFTVDSPYLNFKVAGGRHPHVPSSVMGDSPAPAGETLADFEQDTYDSWTATGTAFGDGPAPGTLPGQHEVSGHEGGGLVNTFLGGDATTGTLTSPEFTVTAKHLNFLIGGGNHPSGSDAPTAVRLVVDGRTVRSATGTDSESLTWVSWDLGDLAGRTAHIEVVDENTGGWGHILLDQVMLSDTPARPRSTETAVNLLIDGKIVQSRTGADSGSLDWTSFDLRAHQGKQATLQIVDMNKAGWGHILADHFVAADQPAVSSVQRADWVDYGKDYYAAVSWEDSPDGKRHMIGWMNNWQYGNNIPTSPWRSAQSIPREMALRTVSGRLRLTQQPVSTVESLHGLSVSVRDIRIADGSVPLAAGQADGKALDIRATFTLGDAERFGFKVRTGEGQETVIGYDEETGELYVDRTRSGAVDFHGDFPGVQRAPLTPRNGKIELRILVDWSSVEVFGGEGEAVITDQIFPSPDSDGVRIFAEGGSVRLDRAKVKQVRSHRD